MLYRTWPYGTRYKCSVLDVYQGSRVVGIVCQADELPKEAFVLMHRPGEVQAAKGDRGTITFTKGGPTGGYWKFERE